MLHNSRQFCVAREAAAVIARLLLRIMQLISWPQKLEIPISYKASKRFPQLQFFSNYLKVKKILLYLLYIFLYFFFL